MAPNAQNLYLLEQVTLSRLANGSDARVDDAAVRQRCRARDMVQRRRVIVVSGN